MNGRNNEIALSTVLAISHAQKMLNKYIEASLTENIVVRIRYRSCPGESQSQEGRQTHKQVILIQCGQCGDNSLWRVLQTPIKQRLPSSSLGVGWGVVEVEAVKWSG